MDIVDELTDLSGAPPHEVQAVANKAIKEIERLREALKEILTHETDYEPYDCIEIARAALREIEE